MPAGFQNLYKTVASKVDIPPKKYIDWPIGMNSQQNFPFSLSRTMNPELFVSQPNLPPLLSSQIPSPTRQLREQLPAARPEPVIVVQDPAALSRAVSSLKEQRVKIATLIMAGDFASLASDAQEWKKRRDEAIRLGGLQNNEVKMAQEGELFLNQFLVDNDDGMLQFGLIQAYQTNLNIDIWEQGVNGGSVVNNPSQSNSPNRENNLSDISIPDNNRSQGPPVNGSSSNSKLFLS